MTDTPDLPYSAPCERNKKVILEVLSLYFDDVKTVLEVGSGSAQHAVFFGKEMPELVWQTSDQSQYLNGINAQLQHAKLTNVIAPVELDVNQKNWLSPQYQPQKFDAIFTANTLHIMSEKDVAAFFSGLNNVVAEKALLLIYGPFTYAGEFTSPSNQEFDTTLRLNGRSSIKSFERVNQLAEIAGFKLLADHSMPANNQCLVWRRP